MNNAEDTAHLCSRSFINDGLKPPCILLTHPSCKEERIACPFGSGERRIASEHFDVSSHQVRSNCGMFTSWRNSRVGSHGTYVRQ